MSVYNTDHSWAEWEDNNAQYVCLFHGGDNPCQQRHPSAAYLRGRSWMITYVRLPLRDDN